jgi:hypothetical protein
MIVLAGLNGAERSCNDSDEEDRQLLRTATAQSTPFGERASACLPLTLCVRSPPPPQIQKQPAASVPLQKAPTGSSASATASLRPNSTATLPNTELPAPDEVLLRCVDTPSLVCACRWSLICLSLWASMAPSGPTSSSVGRSALPRSVDVAIGRIEARASP